MLDSIKFTGQYFSIRSDNKLTFQFLEEKNEEKYFSGLMVAGKLVKSDKAFYNDDFIYLTVKAVSLGNKMTGTFLTVQSSIDRLLGIKGRIENPTYQECRKAINKIPELIASCGIDVDLNQFYVSRIDTALNVKTDFPVSEYIGILRNFYSGRHKIRDYESTVSFLNASTQFIFYDKIKDFHAKGFEIETEENVLRSEYRKLKKQSVERMSYEIPFSGLTQNLEEISILSFSGIIKFLEKHEKNIIESKRKLNFEISDLRRSLEIVFQDNKRPLQSLKNIIFLSVVNSYGIDNFSLELLKLGAGDKMINRLKNELNNLEASIQLSERDIKQLFTEYIEKLKLEFKKYE